MANNIGIDGFVNQQKLILSRKNSKNLFKNMLNPCLLIVGKNDLITTVDLFMEMFDVLKTFKKYSDCLRKKNTKVNVENIIGIEVTKKNENIMLNFHADSDQKNSNKILNSLKS